MGCFDGLHGDSEHEWREGGGLEVADGLQRAVHLQLEVVELADGGEEGVRLETDLLVQTHLHQVQIPRELRGKG